MRTSLKLAALAVVVGVVGVTLDDGTAPGGAAAGPAVREVPPAASASTSPTGPGLLVPAGNGDGDSWRDTQGREYRLGLVNTPEHDECFGAEATAERRARTADGFRASVYETDRYGRAVAVVTTADGRNLNVHLARNGFADDRFLAEFRAEHEELARQLDDAFAAARQEGKGLWSACAAGAAPARAVAPAQPAAGAGAAGCHPDYRTCVPVRGDGSGRGRADDLDCGGVPGAVQLRQPGVDPYRFDADGDGIGCDS
jgi:endonuclease YncB( thermonuclease family)